MYLILLYNDEFGKIYNCKFNWVAMDLQKEVIRDRGIWRVIYTLGDKVKDVIESNLDSDQIVDVIIRHMELTRRSPNKLNGEYVHNLERYEADLRDVLKEVDSARNIGSFERALVTLGIDSKSELSLEIGAGIYMGADKIMVPKGMSYLIGYGITDGAKSGVVDREPSQREVTFLNALSVNAE